MCQQAGSFCIIEQWETVFLVLIHHYGCPVIIPQARHPYPDWYCHPRNHKYTITITLGGLIIKVNKKLLDIPSVAGVLVVSVCSSDS